MLREDRIEEFWGQDQASFLREEEDKLSQWLGADILTIARIEQKRQGKSLGQICHALNFITQQQFEEVLWEVYKIHFYEAKNLFLDTSIVKIFSKNAMKKLGVLPLYRKGSEIGIGVSVLGDSFLLRRVQQELSDFQVKFYFVSQEVIQEGIHSFLGQSQDFKTLVGQMDWSNLDHLPEQFMQNLFNSLVSEAFRRRASDIHLGCGHCFVKIRLRIDGVLVPISHFHRKFWESFAVYVKLISGMNIAETRQPQVGRLSFSVLANMLDLRLSTHPIFGGESIVIRLLDKQAQFESMSDLGLDAFSQEKISKILEKPEGLIVVTGPTGAGKTTTLYTLLRQFSSDGVNIMTLEQPIEYQIPGSHQTEIREAGGMTFAEGVRSILRQDPDVIFIGEVRDSETAQMAMRAAMTGHRVYTTLHTNDTFSAIERLKELGLPLGIIVQNLTAVISQRLVRRLCKACKTLVSEKNQPPVYRAVGCEDCLFTGYRGRVPVFEVLEFTEQVRAEILQGCSFSQIRKQMQVQDEFRTLQDQAKVLLEQGETTLAEIKEHIDVQKND